MTVMPVGWDESDVPDVPIGLDLLALRPAWMAMSACDGSDADFFPDRGSDLRPAKAVCRDCPVREPCLDFALEEGIRHGIWGGTSERERRGLRKVFRGDQQAA